MKMKNWLPLLLAGSMCACAGPPKQPAKQVVNETKAQPSPTESASASGTTAGSGGAGGTTAGSGGAGGTTAGSGGTGPAPAGPGKALEIIYHAEDGTLVAPTEALYPKQTSYFGVVYNLPAAKDSLFIDGKALPAEQLFECPSPEKESHGVCFHLPGLAGLGADGAMDLREIKLSVGADGPVTSAIFALADSKVKAATSGPEVQCDYKRAQRALKEVYGYVTDKSDAAMPRKHKLKDEFGSIPRNIYDEYNNFAILFFNEEGKPLFPLPDLDEDDKIVIVVVPGDCKPLKEFRITTCDAPVAVRVPATASPAPSPGAGEGTPSGALAAAPPPPQRVEDPKSGGDDTRSGENPVEPEAPYAQAIIKACSADRGVKGVVRGSKATTVSEITANTLPLVRFTFGFGFVYDFTQVQEYRAEPVKGESSSVIVAHQSTQGLAPPIPFIAVRPVRVSPAKGRSLCKGDWIAPALGISLTAPLDNVYVGGLIEPIPGFGILSGLHIHTVPTLAGGYAVGDRVPSGTVATDKHWDLTATRPFVGLSVDTALLAKLLSLLHN